METNIATTTRQSIVTSAGVNADLMSRFIAFLDATPKTAKTYTTAVKQMFLYFAENDIKNPVREDVIAYREYLKATGHKATTIQLYIIAARLFFQWTEQEGIYPNIAQHIKGAKLNRDHRKDYLTSDQVKEILAGIDRTTLQGKRDFALLSLMVSCGLRDIDVYGTNIEDLRTVADFTAIFVQGKGRQEKTEYIRVPEKVCKAVREYLKERKAAADTEPLFISLSNNSYGERMSTRSISGTVKAYMVAAGYDSNRLTAHCLRHTAVTLAILAGERMDDVQAFARHANIATTMIYNHAVDRAKNGCSEAVAASIF